MQTERYSLNQITELMNLGLINDQTKNNLASKPEIYYPSGKNRIQGGLCMEGKVRNIDGWRIDFRRRLIGGFISRDEFGRKFWSKEHAEQYLNMIRAEVTNGTFNIDKYRKLNIEVWKFEKRFERYLAAGVDKKMNPWAPSYKIKVKGYYHKYFKPFFKSWDLRVLSDSHVKDFYTSLPKHLSPKTKHNIIGVLRAFYSSFRELEKNKIDWPSPHWEKPIINWINQKQQEKIFAFIPEKHRPIFYFMIWHGVRPGEARALLLDCVKIEKKQVIIKRTFSLRQLRDKTKGKKSRILPLYEKMIPILESLPRRLNSEFVFTNEANTRRGRYYGENFLNELWNKAVEDAGYAPIKLYDATRHSFASQLREAGANLSDIQELLGHSDSRMTERYAHAEQKRLTRIINMRRR